MEIVLLAQSLFRKPEQDSLEGRRAKEIVQKAKKNSSAKHDFLSYIPRKHLMGGENLLLQVAHWHPHRGQDTRAHTQKHLHVTKKMARMIPGT